MVVRFETSRSQWRKISKFLPGKPEDPGRTAYDNRLAFEGLLYIAGEGCRWRALPDEYGQWDTLYQRFRRWLQQGVFDLLAEIFIARYRVDVVMVDGTIVPVHQDGTGARKALGTPEEQAIGISRGGRTTKILAASDEKGNLIASMLLPGNAGEAPHAPELIEEIEAGSFIGDKAYDSDRLIEWLRDRGTEQTIPPRRNRKVQRRYDEEQYKTRHLVENVFQKMKRYRHLFTRYDKKAECYSAFIILVMVHLFTRTAKSTLREVSVVRRKRRKAAEVYVPEGELRAIKRDSTDDGAVFKRGTKGR